MKCVRCDGSGRSLSHPDIDCTRCKGTGVDPRVERPWIDVYLATPYSHPEPSIQEWRFERVTEATAILISRGIDCIYSPITHTHPIDKHLTNRQADHEFWVNKFDLPFLANSRMLYILQLPGWENSTGIKMEIEQARVRGIPVYLVEPLYDDAYQHIVDVVIK